MACIYYIVISYSVSIRNISCKQHTNKLCKVKLRIIIIFKYIIYIN